MSGELFTLDTNILIYSIDRKSGERHETAKLIVRCARLRRCHLTLQAISEFYAATTRKRMIQPAAAAQVARDMMDLFHTVTASPGAVRMALISAATGKASYWDALLVATAAEAGCTAILTEDLTDGATLHGVRVINPFGAGTLTPGAAALLAAD